MWYWQIFCLAYTHRRAAAAYAKQYLTRLKPSKMKKLITVVLFVYTCSQAIAQFVNTVPATSSRIDPNSIQGGRYANQAAIFSAAGVLQGLGSGTLAKINVDTETVNKLLTLKYLSGVNSQLMAADTNGKVKGYCSPAICVPDTAGQAGKVLEYNGSAVTWATASGGGPQVFQDSIFVSSEQILNSATSPVQLEPGIPGHNYQILAIREEYTYGTTPYTEGTFMFVTQDNSTFGTLFSDIALILSTASGSVFMINAYNGTSTGVVRGDPLTLYAGGGGSLTGGDGTLKIYITYTIF